MDQHTVVLVLGFLSGLVIAAFLVAFLLKKKVLDNTFDERQERARGVAFKYGFFTLMICIILYGLSEILLDRWCDAFTGGMICICISVTVFAAVCIRKDAYLSLNERPKRIIQLFSACVVMNLALGLIPLLNGELMEDGIVSFRAANLIAGAAFLIILILYVVKLAADKRVEE